MELFLRILKAYKADELPLNQELQTAHFTE